MGFFNFFSKEKKETLDKGLSKTKESVRGKGSECPAGCASHPAARAVQVLGLAGGLLSLYPGRCL